MIAAFKRNMNDLPLSEILQQFLSQNHKEEEFKAHSAADLYMELFVPENCKKDILQIKCENGNLYVKTANAGLRFELLNQRSHHLEILNEHLQGNIVKNIVLQ